MPTVKYLNSSIPQVNTPTRMPNTNNGDDRFADLEQRISEMNEQLTKQNRDNLDAEYNIDEDNLGESLLKIIRDLQSRVKALEEIVDNL